MQQEGSSLVNDLAAERASAPQREYTIADAVADAQFYRRQPEVVVDPKQAKRTIDALLSALERSQCYFKATLKGEEVFVLRQQDRAAPAAIMTWAEWAAAHGCRQEKVEQAYREAEAWRVQPEHLTKWPD